MKYIFLTLTYFCGSCIIKEEINELKQLHLSSCGALERGNNPYVEFIEKACISKNQKEIFAMWVYPKLKVNLGKELRQWKKVFMT